MKKIKLASIFVFGILIILILVDFLLFGPVLNAASVRAVNSSAPEISLTYKNLASVLSGSDMVQDVPKNSELLLRFYNSDFGALEKEYTIRKGVVQETKDSKIKADIVFSLDSKYLVGLTTHNFCSAIQQARANGDLGIDIKISMVSLAWKYRPMFKYRECFGF